MYIIIYVYIILYIYITIYNIGTTRCVYWSIYSILYYTYGYGPVKIWDPGNHTLWTLFTLRNCSMTIQIIRRHPGLTHKRRLYEPPKYSNFVFFHSRPSTQTPTFCVCVSQQHQALKQKVDDEVKRIVDEQYQRGMKLLRVTWMADLDVISCLPNLILADRDVGLER